jgi:signal transduction histidine kinase/DNA-binding response OmpR family regulator
MVSGQWSAADGLPVDTVNSLTLDAKGRLWIGTHDGLSRFDGFDFTHFNADSTPSLPSNRISRVDIAAGLIVVRFESGKFGRFTEEGYQHIGETSRENLHTDDAGLWYTEGGQLMRWQPDTGAHPVAAFEGLDLLYPAPTGGQLFLVTDASNVIEFKPTENRARVVTDSLEGPVLAVASSPEGQLAVMTRSALKVFDTRDYRLQETIALPGPQWDQRVMTWTPEGWLATMDGAPPLGRLMRISQHGVAPIESAPHDFHHFVLSRTDDQGQLWVNQGTRLYRDGELIHDGTTPIHDFRFDRYGQVWLGTRHGGLKQLTQPVMQAACPQGNCMEDQNTYLVTGYGDGLLIGNQFALYHHSPEQRTWTRLMHFHALSALADGDDILIGGNGLCRLQPDHTCAGGQPPPDPEIRMLMRDHTDAVWMGSNRGLFRRAPDGQWSDQPLATAFVRAAATLDDKHLVFGTMRDGVLMAHTFSPARPIEVIASTENGLASNAVRSLHVLPDRRLLVGLEDRGICLVDPGAGVERCVSVADGLPHHSAHRMIEDDFGRLWVNTNNGIYLVEIKHLVEFLEGNVIELSARRFDTRDGMPGNEGNGNLHQAGTRTADGRIWFPNQHGVVVIHPDRAGPTQHRLSASITPLGHAAGETITLAPGARLLRTRLGATALRGARSVQFRYRLAEHAPWNFIGNQTELAFESLAPGSYQLQVQARYSDGQWPDEISSLAFGVPPRLTERRSFWLMVALAGLFLLGSLFWRERAHVFRLEHKVGQRTAELSQALATVRAQAANIRHTANRRHQLFLAIGHELRTPLTLILGPLRDRTDPPDQQQLERMRQSAEQMQTLIEQILDLEQIEHAGAGEFHPQPLSALLTRSLEMIAATAEAKPIELEDSIQDVEPHHWVQADSAHLDRALLILLDNAIKYAPRNGLVRLSVSMLPHASHAAIHIEDNGPGIPPGQRPDVFEPFVRGKTDQPGLGLGLALCRRIVEQHGGTITVGDSQLGGACFTLELPLVDAPAQAQNASSPNTMKVLIVDDNPGIRAHVAEILAGRWEVLQAAGAHEAERLARSESPNVMLVDASMPQVDGLELIRRLHEDEQTAAIATILFTAHGHRDMEVRAFRAGADHYLEKPFTADQLLSRIERVMARQAPVMPPAALPPSPARQTSEIPRSPAKSSTFMSRLEQVLHDHLDDAELDVDQLAALCGTSRASLYRKLNDYRNATPAEFIREFRLRRAAEMLRQTDANISKIAFAVGFRRLSAFTRAFRTYFNCTPSDYRKTHTEPQKPGAS